MDKNMSRRSALRAMGTSAAALAVGTNLSSAAPDKEAPSALKGNINHAVCRWCYSKISFDEFCSAAREMGIKGIDLLETKDFSTVKRHGLACSMVSGVPGGITEGLNRVENHDRIFKFFDQTMPTVAEHGFKNIICFSGNRNGMSDKEGLENCAVGLERIMPLAQKHKLTVCMELLNSRRNHPDYMCDHTAWGAALCEKVGSEHFKLLYDIYHMQIMDGDIIDTIKENHKYIGHYHTGGVPGRAEIDDTQEIYYPAVMKAIVATGFKGFVAQEFMPKRDALASLKQALQICDV